MVVATDHRHGTRGYHTTRANTENGTNINQHNYDNEMTSPQPRGLWQPTTITAHGGPAQRSQRNGRSTTNGPGNDVLGAGTQSQLLPINNKKNGPTDGYAPARNHHGLTITVADRTDGPPARQATG